MPDERNQALITYGISMLDKATRGAAQKSDTTDLGRWKTYEDVLSNGHPLKAEERLTSVFSRISLDEKHTLPAAMCYAPEPLVVDGTSPTIFPKLPDQTPTARESLWQKFDGEWQTVATEDTDRRFEIFYHLYRKYAWAVPCTYGEKGVSLFEQWKAIAALVFASGERWDAGPAQQFSLVGGDIPGIQDFVYTITSKGAAKGLRGRSFFLQLLSDAVVRRIVADLGLCPANVVYNAGGNFMVLGPAESVSRSVIETLRQRINKQLARAIQGETHLVLEAIALATADLGVSDRFRAVRDTLAGQVAAAKNRPLKDLLTDYADVFGAHGKGSPQSCVVCKVEVDDQTSRRLEQPVEGDEASDGEVRICHLCESFGDLARSLAHDHLWMGVQSDPTSMDRQVVSAGERWDDLLAKMTGWRYSFAKQPPHPAGKNTRVYTLNNLDFLTAGGTGFRLVANVTPRVDEDDRRHLREDRRGQPDDIPQVGDIRTFELLARAAKWDGAIERVGILKMDGDGLGRVFGDGLPNLTLPLLSALSAQLDVFFGGYLNTIVQQKGGRDVYVIYAGGDDLFMVGAWHKLPELAAHIRQQFKAFTGQHPRLSISGGITLENPTFPLYRAAERVDEAEHMAKDLVRPGNQKKDALCFLGTVVGWDDEWPDVVLIRDRLLSLTGQLPPKPKEAPLPAGLIQLVLDIHSLYRSGLVGERRRFHRKAATPGGSKRSAPNPRLFFGRWMWMKVYRLTQMEKRYHNRLTDKDVRGLRALRDDLLDHKRVHLSGLAARWAEYLTRGK